MCGRAAPEVISNRKHYDGKQVDVWSAGVMLFVMLFCECDPHSDWIPSLCLHQNYLYVPDVHAHHIKSLDSMYLLGNNIYAEPNQSWAIIIARYPFERPEDRTDARRFQKVLQRILVVDYVFPPKVPVSAECKDLISRILVADPNERITVEQVRLQPPPLSPILDCSVQQIYWCAWLPLPVYFGRYNHVRDGLNLE